LYVPFLLSPPIVSSLDNHIYQLYVPRTISNVVVVVLNSSSKLELLPVSTHQALDPSGFPHTTIHFAGSIHDHHLRRYQNHSIQIII